MKGTEFKFKGMTFITGISVKFDRDLKRVVELLSNGEPNAKERLELLSIYHVAFHDDGKIEGISSCDSSCTNCEFCQSMLKAAEDDMSIICALCYDKAQEAYKIHGRNRHSLDMLIMSSVEFTESELARIPLTEITRINSSGDTPNLTYARNMIKLAKVNGWVHVGYWAKNTGHVVRACDELGKPSNLVLIQSSVHIGKPAKLCKYFDYTFTVYPDDETTEAAIRSGSAECNGMKCKECGFKCYYGTHLATDIAEVLRGVNKTKRKAIIEACKYNRKENVCRDLHRQIPA